MVELGEVFCVYMCLSVKFFTWVTVGTRKLRVVLTDEYQAFCYELTMDMTIIKCVTIYLCLLSICFQI